MKKIRPKEEYIWFDYIISFIYNSSKKNRNESTVTERSVIPKDVEGQKRGNKNGNKEILGYNGYIHYLDYANDFKGQ